MLFNTTLSPLPFWMRTTLMMILLLAAVGVGGQQLLWVGLPLALIFRRLACETWEGLGREAMGAAWLTVLVCLLALPSGGKGPLELVQDTFLRFFLFLSSSQTFVRSLYPREGIWWISGHVSGGVTLTIDMALRFMPLLAAEARDVFLIQRARGAFSVGPLSGRVRAMILPFFFRLFRISERVEFALKARGIDPAQKRCLIDPQHVINLVQTIERQTSCRH